MPLIEGIGNEVVHFAAVVVLAAVAALAWWSTNARPDRYRIVLAMRHHTPPQAVSLRIRTGAPQPSVIYMNRLSNASWLHTPESVTRGGVRNSFSDALVPLQEMDSMVDADMALLENNRLRFYRGVQPARVVLNTSEASTEESESQEESEPASNAQIREMDSIVSAMEADVSTGCEVFNRPNENNSNSDAPLITRVKKEKKESAPNTNDSSQESEPTIGDEANNAVVHVNDRKILIKLKYLNDTLKEVEGSLDELLKDFKWRHFSRELTSECRVRLIYNGRVLGDDSATLRALGLRDRSVVHCLVHPQSRTEERTPVTNGPTVEATGERADRHWDLENILMTLVSVALTVVWFFRCEYSNMFTASASVALFGLTVFYSVAIFGLYLSDTFHFDRRQPQPVPNN